MDSKGKGVMIPISKEIPSRVWEIPIYGMTINCLRDKAMGFRCILEREDIRGVSVVVAN